MEFHELKSMARELYETHHPHLVLLEDCASGQSLIQELKRNDTRDRPLPIYPVRHDKAKYARANASQPMVRSGLVKLPNAGWTKDFISEMELFPNTKHDDQVDAFSSLINYCRFRPHLQEPATRHDPLLGRCVDPMKDLEVYDKKPLDSVAVGDIFEEVPL